MCPRHNHDPVIHRLIDPCDPVIHRLIDPCDPVIHRLIDPCDLLFICSLLVQKNMRAAFSSEVIYTLHTFLLSCCVLSTTGLCML